MHSSSITLTVLDPVTHAVVCQTSSNIRTALTAKNHAINLSACSQLPGNNYLLTITDPGHGSRDLLYNTQMLNAGTFTPMSSLAISRANNRVPFKISSSMGTVYVLYDLNPQISAGVDDTACQEDASPLVLDTTPFVDHGNGLPLSSPAQGVMFDILGGNSYPTPHAPKQISWFHDPNYMFLVLPDQNGQVTGIDQMFGNNTKGPDGQFAANGFAALAKYDTNHDDFIDSRDPIFAKLRLWSDKNADGKVQTGELHTLAELGITRIRVRYNKNFSEQDAYGNLTRFESNVQYRDGKSRRIFDVWFAIY